MSEQASSSEPARDQILRMVPKAEPAPDATPEISGAETMLLDLLEDIQTGKLKPHMLVVHCLTESAPGGTLRNHYWTWNIRPLEHLGLLDMARYSIMAEDNPPI